MAYLIAPSHRGSSRPSQARASRLLRRDRVFARMLTTSASPSSSANRSASACKSSSDSARGAAFRNAENSRSTASVATVDCGSSSVLTASLNAVTPQTLRPRDERCTAATKSNSGFYRRLVNSERRLASISPLSAFTSQGKPYRIRNHDCSPRAGAGRSMRPLVAKVA